MRGLLELQQQMAEVVMQPLTRAERMRKRTSGHQLMTEVANSFVRPNDRLTSFERLEIYNRQHWFRLIDALSEDFPGLQAILGAKRFRTIAKAYITECPPIVFIARPRVALASVAGIASRTAATERTAGARYGESRVGTYRIVRCCGIACSQTGRLGGSGAGPRLTLQPYVTVLELKYPVDDILIVVRKGKRSSARVPIRKTEPEAMFLAIHRAEFSVRYKRLEQEAYLLLSAIKGGLSLSDALDFAFAHSDLATGPGDRDREMVRNVDVYGLVLQIKL